MELVAIKILDHDRFATILNRWQNDHIMKKAGAI